MDKLPDDILLRIFSFIDLKQRIILRIVSWRWSCLIHDNSLLRKISIRRAMCEDNKLQASFTASTRLTEVDLFSSHILNGSCILYAGLSRLRLLTLTGTAVTDFILSRILEASKELIELHLAGTRISNKCLPQIVGLKKLEYISVPPENVHGFSRSSALALVANCGTLRTLDCQDGYFFYSEEVYRIVESNLLLTGLVIPYAFVDNCTLTFIVESLRKLAYICVCETGLTLSLAKNEQRSVIAKLANPAGHVLFSDMHLKKGPQHFLEVKTLLQPNSIFAGSVMHLKIPLSMFVIANGSVSMVQKYISNDCSLILWAENEKPVFGDLLGVWIANGTDVLFRVAQLETLCFNHTLNSFEVDKLGQAKSALYFAPHNLLTHEIVHKWEVDNKVFINTKHDLSDLCDP